MHGLNSYQKKQSFCKNICDTLFKLEVHKFSSLLFCLVFLTSCTQKNTANTAALDPKPTIELSAEGKQLYYYLTLSDALNSKDTDYLAETLIGLVKIDKSEELFEEAASILLRRKAPAQAVIVAEQGIIEYPNNELLHILLAGAFGEVGQTQKAIEVLEKYMAQHGKTPEVLTETIRLFLKSENLKKAEKYLAYLPAESSSQAMYFHIHLHNQKNEFSKAKALLHRYIKKNPKAIEGYLDLGLIAENQRDYTLAVESYKNAARLEPNNFEIWLRIISMLLLAEKPEQAKETLLSLSMPPKFTFQAIYFFADAGYAREAEDLLNRKFADKRIFPAVDVVASGTRKEEILMGTEELSIVWRLRRVLHALEPQQALELLLEKMKGTKSNRDFIMAMNS